MHSNVAASTNVAMWRDGIIRLVIDCVISIEEKPGRSTTHYVLGGKYGTFKGEAKLTLY